MEINLAAEYYNAAVEYVKLGDFPQAQVLYINSMIEDPNNLEAVMGLYEIYTNKKDFEEETIRLLKRAMEINPEESSIRQHRTIDEVTDELARYMVGVAEFYLKNKRHNESKVNKAVELMEEAFELKPYLEEQYVQDYALMLYVRGETFSQLEDAQKAYGIFEQEINENPENLSAQIGLKGSKRLIKELTGKD